MYILFDIGGTNMRIARSVNGKTFTDPIIIKTPKTFSRGLKQFQSIALTLSKGEKIKAIAGGIAGPLNKEKTKMVNSPNIGGWVGKPFAATLRKTLRAPVYLENDTAIVGLGEATHGAGKTHSIVAYLTVSTGVNGVRIINKSIDVSAFGFEIGHHIIAGTEKLEYGRRDRFGSKVSGIEIQKKYKKRPRDISDKKTWEHIAFWVARGLVNVAVFWSPEVIILGGSMMKKRGVPIDRVKYYYNKLLYIFPVQPRILRARLGNIGGLYGALALVAQKRRKK